MEANPTFGVIKGDMRNGYNEVKRESCLQAMRNTGRLDHILAHSHTLLDPVLYIKMGSGVHIEDAGFRSCDGLDQGAIEAGLFFSLAIDSAMQNMNRTLGEAGGGVVAIIDDNYPMGPPEVLFKANNQLKADLKKVGLELQLDKSACYINKEHRMRSGIGCEATYRRESSTRMTRTAKTTASKYAISHSG